MLHARGCCCILPPESPPQRITAGPSMALKSAPTSCHRHHVAGQTHSTQFSPAPRRLHLQQTNRRVAASFSKLLPLQMLFGPASQPTQPVQPLHSLDHIEEADSLYSTLLQQAEDITFNAPELVGRAGNRCMLEDAERMLELCIQERPQQLQPRVLLLRNLMRQSQGRERDVPYMAVCALEEADLPGTDGTMMRRLHALQIVMLGLKAIYKLKEEEVAAPAPVGLPSYTTKSFLAAVQAAAPALAADFANLAGRVQRQLLCCSTEQRLSMLDDKDGYMSSVDLSAVCGQHHVVGGDGPVTDGVRS